MGISPLSRLGGEVFDREILKRLAGLDVQVQILLPENLPVEAVSSWKLYRTAGHRWNYYEYNWIFLRKVLSLARDPGFDLLRIHSPTLAPLGWITRRLTRRPVAAQIHHLDGNRLAGWMSHLIMHTCDLITTDSDFSRQQILERYRVPQGRIQVASPGVDEKFCPQPGNERLAEQLGVAGSPVLFYLGSLIPRKNLTFLLDVLAIVLKEVPRARLVLAGSGYQERALRDRAEALGLTERVIFPGPIPEEEKVAYYNLADIFVLPSFLEGFGLVAAEAMACGKPVVAANAASLPEVVADEQTGYLADPHRPEDFAGKILRLLQDEPLRRAMGQAGLERVRRLFSWDASALEIRKSYERVIKAS